jgi:hypothetical protein
VTARFEHLEESAPVICPYCGETVEVRVDPGGGSRQAYVEDCHVCCRPWQVTARIGRDGTLVVQAEALDRG